MPAIDNMESLPLTNLPNVSGSQSRVLRDGETNDAVQIGAEDGNLEAPDEEPRAETEGGVDDAEGTKRAPRGARALLGLSVAGLASIAGLVGAARGGADDVAASLRAFQATVVEAMDSRRGRKLTVVDETYCAGLGGNNCPGTVLDEITLRCQDYIQEGFDEVRFKQHIQTSHGNAAAWHCGVVDEPYLAVVDEAYCAGLGGDACPPVVLREMGVECESYYGHRVLGFKQDMQQRYGTDVYQCGVTIRPWVNPFYPEQYGPAEDLHGYCGSDLYDVLRTCDGPTAKPCPLGEVDRDRPGFENDWCDDPERPYCWGICDVRDRCPMGQQILPLWPSPRPITCTTPWMNHDRGNGPGDGEDKCVSGHNIVKLGTGGFDNDHGISEKACCEACLAHGPDCVGIEWFSEDSTNGSYKAGECILASSTEAGGCDNENYHVHFFEISSEDYYAWSDYYWGG